MSIYEGDYVSSDNSRSCAPQRYGYRLFIYDFIRSPFHQFEVFVSIAACLTLCFICIPQIHGWSQRTHTMCPVDVRLTVVTTMLCMMRNVDEYPMVGVTVRDILPWFQGEICWQRMQNDANAVVAIPINPHCNAVHSFRQAYEREMEILHRCEAISPHIICTACGLCHRRYQHCPEAIELGLFNYNCFTTVQTILH